MQYGKMIAAAAVLAVLALTIPAGADVYFSDDFETGTLGSAWVNETSGVSVQNTTVLDGSYSMEIADQSTSATAIESVVAVYSATPGNALTEWSFLARVDNTSSISATASITAGFEYALTLRWYHSGQLQYLNSSGGYTNIVAYSTGATDAIQVVLDESSETFDLWVDSTQYVDDAAFSNTTSAGLDRIRLSSGMAAASQVDWYLDDFVVQDVPEPATMGLLGLGGLALLAKRRRR